MRMRGYHLSVGTIPLRRQSGISFAEMRMFFGTVDYVGNQHYVFNIGGNKYRLIVVVKFVMGYVFIRFVGTHQDYDKVDASII